MRPRGEPQGRIFYEGEKMYRYETHCHTRRTSACSQLSAEEIVSLYVENGYAGVFITDHFLNGNTTVNAAIPNASYREKIREFRKGYLEVKECAGDKLQVFFGLEFSDRGTDILLYGWNERELEDQECILGMELGDLCRYCAGRGILTVHAHPFRNAERAEGFRMCPQAEGVEVCNAARSPLSNRLAETYAAGCGKLRLGGSDTHVFSQAMLSGVCFREPISSERDFAERVRKGEGTVFRKQNKCAGL